MQSYSSAPAAPPARERGLALSVLLLLTMLENVVLIGGFVVGAGAALRLRPSDPSIDPSGAAFASSAHRTLLFLALVATFQLGFLAGIWMWKRWGVYGYGVVSAVGMVAGAHLARVSVLGNLGWAVIVTLILIPKWKDFE